MKKTIYSLGLLLALIMCACASSIEEPTIPQAGKEVSFTLNYTFKSGNMSRTNAEVYDAFYEDKIKTKELTIDDYQLEFTNSTSEVKHTFSGKWSNEDKITLLEGKYKVKGTSTAEKNCSDKASIVFSKDIEITGETTQVVLDADYDCALIMFEKTGIESVNLVEISTTYTPFSTYGDYFYCFYRNTSGYPYFEIKRTNGSKYQFKIEDDAFEYGKYYFFTDEGEPATYNLPKMEAGN